MKPLPHEYHLVGSILTCKHCHRAEHVIKPIRNEGCWRRWQQQAQLENTAAEAAARYFAQLVLAWCANDGILISNEGTTIAETDKLDAMYESWKIAESHRNNRSI